ncbi:MAG: LuxR family transcriptional regulator [Bacteroidota bacterium]
MPTISRWVFTTLCSIICIFNQANAQLPDSVGSLLEQENLDSDEVEILLKSTNQLIRSNPDQCYEVIQRLKSFELSKDQLVKSYRLTAGYFITQGNYDSAKWYNHESIRYFEDQKDTLNLGETYSQLAVIHYYQSDFENAINHMLTAAELLESINDTLQLAGIYNNLGSFYQRYESNFEKAIELYTKAYYRKLNNGDLLSANRTLGNIGSALTGMGKLDTGVMVLKRTLPIKIENNDIMGVAITYSNIGSGYFDAQVYDSAASYFERAVEKDREINDLIGLPTDLYWLAEANFKLNKVRKAQKLLDESKKYNKDKTITMRSMNLESEILYALGNFKTSLSIFKQYKNLQDSMFNLGKDEIIQELQTKYETAKKEKEIAFLEQENKLTVAQLEKERQFQLFLTILSLVIIISAVVIIYNLRKKKQLEAQTLQAEISQLRAEIKTQTMIRNQSIDKPLEQLNDDLPNPLSEREYDVLQMIFTEKTNREIAEELFVSVNTIKTHLKNLYTKLGVSNRQEARQRIVG